MSVRANGTYKKAFQIATILVPLAMAALGYFYGDVKPVIQDVCGLLVGDDAERPSVTTVQDAGVR